MSEGTVPRLRAKRGALRPRAMKNAIALVLLGCGSTQVPEDCEIRVGDRCFSDQAAACEAAGCEPGQCVVLESYPGQIECTEPATAGASNPDLESPACSRPDNRCVATECGTLPADWTSCSADSDCALAEASNVCGCTDGRPTGPFIAVNTTHRDRVAAQLFGEEEEPFPCACDCTATAHCVEGTCTVRSP
jgi:hypothetical protein